MDKEELKSVIREVLLECKIISSWEKNINGIDSRFEEFEEKTERRLKKLEDITYANNHKYVTETKLIKDTLGGEELIRIVSREDNE